jgi:hypothetical protein
LNQSLVIFMPVIIMFVSENRLIENDLVLPLSSRSTRRCSKPGFLTSEKNHS